MRHQLPMTMLALVSALSLPVSVAAQSVTELRQWTETYTVSSVPATLVIDNIWGDVKVRAGAGDMIVVSINERRSAPDQRRFDLSQKILKLNIQADSASVFMQVGECNHWRSNDPCRECRVDYQFDVLIPAGSNIEISTVNDGQIDIAGVSGTISANNVNGPIYVDGAHHCVAMSNVNGVVDLSFDIQPGHDCDIETINGDVTLNLPASSGLNLALDQSNGRMASEFEVGPHSIPAQVELIQENGLNRYRIHQLAGLRLAGGGPTFSISSLNGDIQVNKTR